MPKTNKIKIGQFPKKMGWHNDKQKSISATEENENRSAPEKLGRRNDKRKSVGAKK